MWDVQVAMTMLPAALPDRMPVGASATRKEGGNEVNSISFLALGNEREGGRTRNKGKGSRRVGDGRTLKADALLGRDSIPLRTKKVRVGLGLALLDALGRDEDLGRRETGEGNGLGGVEVGRWCTPQEQENKTRRFSLGKEEGRKERQK